jgi:hypothetical protein
MKFFNYAIWAVIAISMFVWLEEKNDLQTFWVLVSIWYIGVILGKVIDSNHKTTVKMLEAIHKQVAPSRDYDED